MHEMRHGLLIAAAEGITVSPSHFMWNVGMTVLITIVDVRATMITNVFTCALNPIMKTAALNVVKLPRRCFPITSIPISILNESGGKGRSSLQSWCFNGEQTACSKEQNKGWNCC